MSKSSTTTRERPLGLDAKQSPNAQDAFRPIPGLISCARVTESVGITRHARATQVAGFIKSSQSHSLVAYSRADLLSFLIRATNATICIGKQLLIGVFCEHPSVA